MPHFALTGSSGFDVYTGVNQKFLGTIIPPWNCNEFSGYDGKLEFPDRKIIVIDSKSASMGEGLVVYKAVVNRNNNMSIEDNAKCMRLLLEAVYSMLGHFEDGNNTNMLREEKKKIESFLYEQLK